MEKIGWGFECWELGSTDVEITAGDGRDILVHKVYGIASAGPAGVPTDKEMVRQTLGTITYNNPWAYYTGTAQPAPNSRTINEVNGNLASINIKQRADEVVHIPFERVLNPPQLCTDGYLRAIIDNQTYGTISITGPATEAIDVEVHCWVDFEYAPAAASRAKLEKKGKAEAPTVAQERREKMRWTPTYE